jgi:DNA-binding MarR family transcriptional regulator
MTERAHDWSLFSSHGLVLLYLAAHPAATLRAASDALGLTERHVARVLKELEAARLLTVTRQGGRNAYTVDPTAQLRHPALAHIPLARLVAALAPAPAAAADAS